MKTCIINFVKLIDPKADEINIVWKINCSCTKISIDGTRSFVCGSPIMRNFNSY